MNLEEHLLTLLVEECVEIAHETTKALRFGLDDRYVKDDIIYKTNRQRIVDEIHDLFGIFDLLQEANIIPEELDRKQIELKKEKAQRYIKHAREVTRTLT